jgi:hypothetical protein
VTARIHTRARPAVAAALAAVGTALLIGIPTDIVPNPWFGREIGVRLVDVVVLIALSVLTGALIATYTVAGSSGAGAPRAGIGSGISAGSPSAARSATRSSSGCSARPARRARSHRHSPRSAPPRSRSPLARW